MEPGSRQSGSYSFSHPVPTRRPPTPTPTATAVDRPRPAASFSSTHAPFHGADQLADLNVQDLSLSHSLPVGVSDQHPSRTDSGHNAADATDQDAPVGERKIKRSSSLSRLKRYVKDKLSGQEQPYCPEIVHIPNTPPQTDAPNPNQISTHQYPSNYETPTKAEAPNSHIVLDSRRGKTGVAATAISASPMARDLSDQYSKAAPNLDTPQLEKSKLKKSGSLSKLKGKIIKKKPKPQNTNPVFGTDIEESPLFSEQDTYIPMFLEKCTCFIMAHGLETEGILRVSGSASKLLEWKAKAEKKYGKMNFNKLGDVHVVAGLLKMYLRELPNPLVPLVSRLPLVEAIEDFNQARKDDNFAETTHFISVFQQEASTWGAYRLRVFLTLFYLLERIAAYSGTNKMDAHNLGVVIGPNIFHDGADCGGDPLQAEFSSDAITRGLQSNAYAQTFVRLCIENYVSLSRHFSFHYALRESESPHT